MFNKKRTILILIAIVIILIGGYKLIENKKIDTYLETQKPRIEKYLKYNYNNVELVTLTGIHKNPMGGFSIKGYINKNKNLNFTVPASIDTDIEYVDGLSDPFFYKNEKFPDQESKSVSEIEEEERNSLSFDEKMKLLEEKNNAKKSSLS